MEDKKKLTLWLEASHRGLSCWMAPALLPGCSSASPGTSQSSAPLLNIFLLPAQAAHIHPKCIWFLLASDGTSGCVGCGAGPKQHSNDQIRANFKSTIKPTIPLHSKRLPWRNPGPGCTNHTAPSMLPREPVFFSSHDFFSPQKSHLIRHEDLQVLVEFSHGAGAVALGLKDSNLSFSSTGVGLVFFDYCIQHLHRIIPPGQQQTRLEMLLGTCEVKTYFSIISIFMAIRRFILRLLGPNCSDNSWHY